MPFTLPKNIETKSFAFELKSVDEQQGIVVGYLSTFNNVDYGYDRVLPGAFTKTINDRKSAKGKKGLFPMLWMHDPDQPIGICVDAKEDEKGLECTFQLDIATNEHGIPNNPTAVKVFSGFKMGYIDEFSMGYQAIQYDHTKVGNHMVRDLKECRLWEGSACTSLQAMNPEAEVTQVKTASKELSLMKEKKDFNDHYREQRISDWIGSDFYNLISALRQSSIDIFNIGDTPEPDAVNTVLNDGQANKIGFISAYKMWVQEGIDLDVSNYLNEQSQSDNVLYQLMTRSTYMDTKAGRAISQENAEKLGAMADQCKDMVAKHGAMMEQHKAMMLQHKSMMEQAQNVADDLSNVIGRPAYADGDDAGQQAAANDEQGGSKSRRGPDTAPPPRDEQPSFEEQLAAELAARVQRKKAA